MHNTAGNSGAERSEMPSNRDHLTRRDVEQLLDGVPARPAALTRLLTSARMIGARADSAGLDSVLADFARRPPASAITTTLNRRSVPKGAIARLASAKMFVVATVAVLATGGIALAATTGNLPDPLPGSPHITTTASETTPGSSAGNTTPSHAEPSPTTADQGATGSSTAGARTSTSAGATEVPAAFNGLCTFWLARNHSNGNADNSPAFRDLIAAAGGVDAVDGYCTALLSTKASGSTRSNQPTDATTAPSGGETASPSGKKTHSNGKVTGK
jgi:hypothetical protein